MTIDGAFTQIAWLQNNYVRHYPSNMDEGRIRGLANQFMESYSEYTDAEVMAAYQFFLNERKDPPVISEVRNRLIYQKNNKTDALERELSRKIIERETYKRPDDIIERDGVRGRLLHRQAIKHFLEDYAAGATKGGADYYYSTYPEIEFVPLGTDLRS